MTSDAPVSVENRMSQSLPSMDTEAPSNGGPSRSDSPVGATGLTTVSGAEEKYRVPLVAEAEKVKTAKMAPTEELSVKITEGMKSLTHLLSTIDDKLAGQNETQRTIAERLGTIPSLVRDLCQAQQSQLLVLSEIKDSVRDQASAQKSTSQTLEKLPGAVGTLSERIEQQAQTGAAVRTSVEGVGKSVQNLVDSTQRAQNSLMAEFRRAQDSHRERLEKVIDRERQTLWMVCFFGLLVVGCLVVFLIKN